MTPLESYLRELRDIRSSGAALKEPSYYPSLSNLLNEVGKTLKPKVRCIMNIANRGAGLPDGGLFTSDQFQKASAAEPLPSQSPARGVIEVKGTGDDAWVTADGPQVSKYWGKYRQVLVTNLRDFVLVGQDVEGKPAILETYRLAESESAFWVAAATPRAFAQKHSERFLEYLRRVLLHAAQLAAPEDVARLLSSYARDAKARLDAEELPALATVREALEDSLGLKFEGDKGEHFFRSTLVQTLFYGVFSAWVLWSKDHPPTSNAQFNWHEAVWYLRVPMIKALFERVATPTKLKPLGLVEVLDWTEAALNRVDRASFFANFEEGHAVQYFYEPFLKAFDPELQKDLGVWYTPPEIIQYMVARVDTVLRDELGLTDGLADPNVYVLDPCCGTGAYLVEVLKHINKTLKDKSPDALVPGDVKQAAMERVFGFEILPAPFVVAHLQLGLLLQNLGAPFSEENNERAGVYLTNALTGWELRDQPPLDWPELEDERRGSGLVKRQKPIIVILGNPPYNAFAGVSPSEEEGLVEDYKGVYFVPKKPRKRPQKSGKQRVESASVRKYRLNDPVSEGGWGIKKFNLDDLYVRFFRLAERRIAEKTGRGIVCFISNFSYLDYASFVIMRQRFLSEFDKAWFDCMNGDSRETGKLTPEGDPDPSVFSTEYNRAGIRKGTAIALMARRAVRDEKPTFRFRHFWGVTKRADLLESLKAKDFDPQYEAVHPNETNRFSFRPSQATAQYLEWPTLAQLCAEEPSNGLMEKRGGALIDIDRSVLEQQMQMYYDPSVDWETLRKLGTGLTENASGFEARKVRPKVQAVEKYEPQRVRRYALRPFDTRWCCYSDVSPLWNRSRPNLWAQCWEGNAFLMARPARVANPEGIPLFFTSALGDNDFLRGHAYYFPIRVRPPTPAVLEAFSGAEAAPIANLSLTVRAYLAKLGIDDPDADEETAGLIWHHSLAIGYSPAYLTENAEGIRQDWPRLPLPDTKDALLTSAALGRQVAALLDTERPVTGVSAGAVRPELKSVGIVQRNGAGEVDLAVTIGWGHAGKAGAVMPGKGKIVEREYTHEERAVIEAGATALGLSAKEAFAHLGETTNDVYLNEQAYWTNVPARVWDYVIGGYPVIKKWLSYREKELLGRPLTTAEAREVRDMARRIAAILLSETQLDVNYEAVKEHTYLWPAPA